jgi:hypothetical protein
MIPKQISSYVKAEIKKLQLPWVIISKRDHYFLKVKGQQQICIGKNSSRKDLFLDKISARKIKKINEETSER